MHILIIKPSGLGDIIHALPILPHIKSIFPEAKISWIVFKEFSSVLEVNPYIDNLIIYHRKGGHLKQLRDLFAYFQKNKVDISLDLQGLARSAIVALISGAKYRLTISDARELSWLFEQVVSDFNPGQHAVERNLELIKYIKKHILNKNEKYELKIEYPLFIKPQAQEEALTFLKLKGFVEGMPLLGICFGSRNPSKCWEIEKFAKLIEHLYEELPYYRFVMLGSKSEENQQNRIISLLRDEVKKYVFPFAGCLNLDTAIAMLKFCKMVVANDNGLLHIAVAMGIPSVSLYGPSSPLQVGPYYCESNKGVVIYKNLPCSPCGRIRPGRRCVHRSCLRSITIEEVKDSVIKLSKIY